MKTKIKEMTEYLFGCNFFDDEFDPEGEEVHLDKALELQNIFPWNAIIEEWHRYLYDNCYTPEEVINFANLLFYYGGADNYNPEPYKFLGYLYANVDMDVYWDEAGDLFDSIAIDILQFQQLINLMDNPYYNPLKDLNILKEVERWRVLEHSGVAKGRLEGQKDAH